VDNCEKEEIMKNNGIKNESAIDKKDEKRELFFVALIILIVIATIQFFQISKLQQQIDELTLNVDEISSDVYSINSQLDYVTRIAENAKNYALSHQPWSE